MTKHGKEKESGIVDLGYCRARHLLIWKYPAFSHSMSAPRPPIRALLIDLSGTLHVGSQATPGAVDALSRLRRTAPSSSPHASPSTHVPFRFCSNTSKEGRNELEARLRGMGFELVTGNIGGATANGREMWTSLGAVGSLLQKRGLRKPFCLLEPSSKDEILRDLGPTSGGAFAPLSQRRLAHVEPAADAEYDSVVVGLAPLLFDYEHLNAAFRVLLSTPPKPLIATHRAKYIRFADSEPSKSKPPHETLSLGPGPFVAALETAAGVQAEVVGKPSRTFFETVIDSFGEDELPEDGRIAIVGDDVETDLGGGAVELGLWRVLGGLDFYQAWYKCL